MFKRSLRSKEETLGHNHASTLDTASNLADVYAAQGCFGDAELMYERVLRGKEKSFGPEHASTLYTVNKLGNIYVARGRLSDAAAMYERVLRGIGVGSPTHIDA
jgi:tetratricopeptide (TPR) repeat protein